MNGIGRSDGGVGVGASAARGPGAASRNPSRSN